MLHAAHHALTGAPVHALAIAILQRLALHREPALRFGQLGDLPCDTLGYEVFGIFQAVTPDRSGEKLRVAREFVDADTGALRQVIPQGTRPAAGRERGVIDVVFVLGCMSWFVSAPVAPVVS
ncbi:MAG TPA: hypothetical protein VGF86_09670 [Candidatus Tumulicola sp.]|jgi:hypothetical protein